MDFVPSTTSKLVTKVAKKESINTDEDEDDSSKERSNGEYSKGQQVKKSQISKDSSS